MWVSRWVTSMPAPRARSTWARSSTSTSAGFARAAVSRVVGSRWPEASTRVGTADAPATGPQR